MVLGDDVDNKTMFHHFNILLSGNCFQKRSFNFSAGDIFMMQYPEFGMTTFFSQFIFSVFILIKSGSPVNNFLNTLWTFFDHDLYGFRIAQSVTGNQRVFDMFFKAVILEVRYPRNAALRILGIGFIGPRFGNDQYFFIRKTLSVFSA